jgi:hypothetical protein
MRLYEIEAQPTKDFDVTQYNNWVNHTPESLKIDFDEYKKKEYSKWQGRSRIMGFRFPIFNTIEGFIEALDNAEIVDADSLGEVSNMTKNSTVDDIKGMVSGYQMPRDVDRIVSGYENNVEMPLPIILKGDKGLHIMAGNTRQSTARAMGITPKALLVDVSAKSQSK